MDSMTNVQFFVLLGTVLAGVIWQRADYHQLSGRIDRVNTDLSGRMDRIEGRIDRINTDLSGRMDHIEGRIDRISDDLKLFYRTLGQHDARLDNIEKKSS